MITTEREAFIAIPKFLGNRELLYVEFNKDESFSIGDQSDLSVDFIVGKDVEIDSDTYIGNEDGKALFRVTPLFYRGKINPHAIQKIPGGLLEDYLKNEEDIDVSSEAVRNTAQEILRQLPKEHRDNPYARINGIVRWIDENVEYSVASPYVVDHVEKVIRMLPEKDRHNPLAILKWSFGDGLKVTIKPLESILYGNHNLENMIHEYGYMQPMSLFNYEGEMVCNFNPPGDEDIESATFYANLPEDIQEPRQLARELINQVTRKWDGLDTWDYKNAQSASTTIKKREGKCVGKSNTYIALARALGIPSRELSGKITNSYYGGGGHRWAASYLHPFGWVEIDPTFGEVEDFDHKIHMYQLPFKGKLPEVTIIESILRHSAPHDIQSNLRNKVKGAIELITGDAMKELSWKDRLFRTEKLKHALNLIETQYGQELEYLTKIKKACDGHYLSMYPSY